MAVTETTDLVDRVIFNDTVQAAFKKRTALIDSILVSSGAIVLSDTMPLQGRDAIGKTIRCPYFGTLGEFATNAEGSSPTPAKLSQTSEDATVARSSLAFETSVWAQGFGVLGGAGNDPYEEAARQIAEAARRRMDALMVTAGAGSPLLDTRYSATVPVYLTYDVAVTAKARKLGDEQDGVIAMVTHSLGMADLATQVDTTGRPILTMPQDGTVPRLAGMPVLVSDSVPLTGSTMGTMTLQAGGTGSATFALTGTPTGPWDLRIKVIATGECGAATIQFSTDGGNTYSATLTTAASGVALPLTDTAADSLVGNNGATGISVAFTNGGGNDLVATEVYSATANLCVESQIWMRGAGAFWYNGAALVLKSDTDILEDTDIGAMHLYAAPHIYRRRLGGTRPGVVRIRHNVRGYVG